MTREQYCNLWEHIFRRRALAGDASVIVYRRMTRAMGV